MDFFPPRHNFSTTEEARPRLDFAVLDLFGLFSDLPELLIELVSERSLCESRPGYWCVGEGGVGSMTDESSDE